MSSVIQKGAVITATVRNVPSMQRQAAILVFMVVMVVEVMRECSPLWVD